MVIGDWCSLNGTITSYESRVTELELRVTPLVRCTMASSTADTLIEIQGLRFAYGEREVLKGIDLVIPRGRIVAILGTSGSGKTTLLRLISGQLKPAAGCV